MPSFMLFDSVGSELGFESRVSEFTLPNGLHFIVLERHNAPVVSCHTHARVGAFIEADGSTGQLAPMHCKFTETSHLCSATLSNF